MAFMPLDIDGTERTCRTKVLAGTATDATLYIDNRNLRRLVIFGIGKHHRDGTGRTMAGTIATLYPIRQRHAVLLDPYGMAYLGR